MLSPTPPPCPPPEDTFFSPQRYFCFDFPLRDEGREILEANKFKDLSLSPYVCCILVFGSHYCPPNGLTANFLVFKVSLLLKPSHSPTNTPTCLPNPHSSHRSHITWLPVKEAFIYTLSLSLSLHYFTTEVTLPPLTNANVLLQNSVFSP